MVVSTNSFGVPYEELILTISEDHINAKLFVDWVRDFNRRLHFIVNGIEEITPADRFALQMVQSNFHYTDTGGSHVTMPDDVRAFISAVRNAKAALTAGEERK